MSPKKLAFLFFFLSLFSVANAQTEALPLSEILAKMAVRYDRIFSYADQAVANKKSEMPPKNFSFMEALDFVEQETGIAFKILGEGYVAVYPERNKLPHAPVKVLEPVVIRNYLTQGITKKRDGAVEIDYENFGILPGLIEPDVLQTLQALPGVESVNETVSNINVRGGSNDQNLILWDGIKMYQSGHFFGLISAFNPHQAEKVILFKNGTDPAFGNSVSSVISMRTEREVNEDFQATVGVNFINLGAFLDTPFGENASLQVSARLSLTPFFITPTYEEYYDRAFQGSEVFQNDNDQIINNNEAFSFNDFSLRWLYNLSEKDRIRVNFINIANELRFDEETLIDGEVESKQSELSQNSLAAGLFYRRNWNQKWKTTAQTYFSNYQLQATNVDLLNDQRLFQENKVVETNFKTTSSLNINKKWDWEIGYEFTDIQITNTQNLDSAGFSNFEKESLATHALFSSVQFLSKNKSTFLQFGTRLNYFEKFGKWRLEPRLSFNQRFLEDFNVEILGELKSQTTTQIIDFQTDFLGIEKRRWRLSNTENIPILHSKQLSTGVNFSDKGWLASMEAYLKEVQGITSQSQGFQGQYQFAQITGSYFVKGIELLVQKDFGNFSSWASYSLTDNNYTFPALPDGNFPNSVEIAHSFNLAASYRYKNFKLSLGTKWRTGKPFTPLTEAGLQSGNLIYEPALSDNLNNYFRVDLSASQTFKLSKKTDAYVGISIWNLLNRENTLNAYYQKKPDGDIVKIEQPGLGITPNLSFRVFF